MKIRAQILTIFICGLFASSCFENPDCIDLRNNFVGFTFKKLYDGEADTVALLGMTVSGVEFTPTTNISSFYLPLNVNTSQQAFDFELIRGGFSTQVEKQRIILTYSSKAQFESVDCSPRLILSDLDVTEHNFDSVNIKNKVPLAATTGGNIDLYRCPITNNLKITFRQLLADDKSNGNELKEKLNGVSLDYLPINFYPNSERGSVILPMNTAVNSTNILIDSKTGLSTLNIAYEIENNVLINACGTQSLIHTIQVTQSTGYDIVRLQKDSITDPPSTNVALLRCPRTNLLSLLLKNTSGGETPFQINKVTADFTPEVFFEDSLASKIILPLDIAKDQTDFVFEFETGPKKISFGYVRTQQTFHEQCSQTLIGDVSVISSDFTTVPIVKKDSIQFPTVVNFEIINN